MSDTTSDPACCRCVLSTSGAAWLPCNISSYVWSFRARYISIYASEPPTHMYIAIYVRPRYGCPDMKARRSDERNLIGCLSDASSLAAGTKVRCNGVAWECLPILAIINIESIGVDEPNQSLCSFRYMYFLPFPCLLLAEADPILQMNLSCCLQISLRSEVSESAPTWER